MQGLLYHPSLSDKIKIRARAERNPRISGKRVANDKDKALF
jgi:hypothetical protein